jgi:hypothetical protein
MNEIEFRVKVMEGMNDYVLETIGDDEITDYWFTYGIPDGIDKSGYLEIAESENEYLDIVKAFGKCLELAEKEN